MSPPSPPRQSPRVPSLGDDPSPSGSHNVATIREAVVIADAAVEKIEAKAAKTEKATRWQWMGISILGVAVTTASGFLVWCLVTVSTLGTAQASTAAKQEATAELVQLTASRVESVDAGGRVAIERLEKKLDDNDAKRDRQNEALNAKIDKIADAVRARH